MTNIKDLTKEAPRSPRVKLGGYVILARTLDKCRALLENKIGDYHFDCPLDNVFFEFKGIKGDDFKAAVKAAKTDEEVLAWVNSHGSKKTAAEIEQWSAQVIASSLYNFADKKAYFVGECQKLGLDPAKTTTFDWLEADDAASYKSKAA